MAIKKEISDRAPTQHTKTALLLLIAIEFSVVPLVAFSNPVTLELDPKNITWLQISVALFLALLFSLYVNFHLTNRLRNISKWVSRHEWIKRDDKQP